MPSPGTCPQAAAIRPTTADRRPHRPPGPTTTTPRVVPALTTGACAVTRTGITGRSDLTALSLPVVQPSRAARVADRAGRPTRGWERVVRQPGRRLFAQLVLGLGGRFSSYGAATSSSGTNVAGAATGCGGVQQAGSTPGVRGRRSERSRCRAASRRSRAGRRVRHSPGAPRSRRGERPTTAGRCTARPRTAPGRITELRNDFDLPTEPVRRVRRRVGVQQHDCHHPVRAAATATPDTLSSGLLGTR